MDNKRSASGTEENGELLIPGIPNVITLDHITPKLPWRVLYKLSCVSSSWKQAIRSRSVYKARVRSPWTETLALLEIAKECSSQIALYSVRDERLDYLPSIPMLNRSIVDFLSGGRGIPKCSQCAYVDGTVYVMGGWKSYAYGPARDDVYALDLAGQRQWRQCTSMHEGREQFGCGVLHGKIYVFGGTSSDQAVEESQVYDPESDVWSLLPPMPCGREDHRVTAIGEELVVHGGQVYPPRNQEDIMEGGLDNASDLNVYNPVNAEWRVVKPLWATEQDILPLEQGQFYAISWRAVSVHSLDEDLKISQRSISSVRIFGSLPIMVTQFSTAVVDGELLGVLRWTTGLGIHSALVRSEGFCEENEEMLWQNTRTLGENVCTAGEDERFVSQVMCALQF